MEIKFDTVLIMVKFVGHDGKICVKCNEAVQYLEKKNLMQYVTNIWTADVRDASNFAIQYAKDNFIGTFPFFIIRHRPESHYPIDEIYYSVGEFATRLNALLTGESQGAIL